jgi:uncharacterized protein YgiM (DUF1202 family)
MKRSNTILCVLTILFESCRLSGAQPESQKAVSLSRDVQLMSEPTQDSEVLHFVQLGDTLSVLDSEDDYLFVRADGKMDGWIQKKFLILKD